MKTIRHIAPCKRCNRKLFVNHVGYCTSCAKQICYYGATWAPVRPWQRTIPSVVLAVFLMLPLAAPWNPDVYAPPGQTYEQHIAESDAFIAQVRAYAIAHCGEQYMPSCEGWQ